MREIVCLMVRVIAALVTVEQFAKFVGRFILHVYLFQGLCGNGEINTGEEVNIKQVI
jgi:hypothetical protein